MLVELDVLINPKTECGLSCAQTISTSFKYAKLVITEKNWSNLFQRIWDAITHIFCKQVTARVNNSDTGDFENQLFWVKGEVIVVKPKISSSLDNPISELIRTAPAAQPAGDLESLIEGLSDEDTPQNEQQGLLSYALVPAIRNAEQKLKQTLALAKLALLDPNSKSFSSIERNRLNREVEEAKQNLQNLQKQYSEAVDAEEAQKADAAEARRKELYEKFRKKKRVAQAQQEAAASANLGKLFN